jgi:Glycosyl hydrolases family 39.
MIKIDLSKKLGEFKPVNGIDNGPVCFGSLIDSSYYYKQAEFTYCRLHDTNWPHPREVDIPTIFKNFSADENDPNSYDFRTTDVYLQQIVNTGAKIIYRLGVSIEHAQLKHYIDPPADFAKWARICLNIARHYNEGWANGYHMGIEYWEVWNEPDLDWNDREPRNVRMWSGTAQQYFDLYAATARIFKREMPYVNIGGYAACVLNNENISAFLQYVKENKLPLDFFSWHTYTTSVDVLKRNANFIREMLDRYGFTDTTAILDEWNCISWGNHWGGIFDPNERGAKARREAFAEASGELGASITAAMLIEMLDLPIDIATLYEGAPTNIFATIFDRYGVPTKQYYAFDVFNRVKQTGERVQSECDIKNIYVTAAASETNDRIAIWIVNNNADAENYKYTIEELRNTETDGKYLYELYLLDKYRNFEKVDERICPLSEIPDSIYMYQHSFAYISIKKR